MKKKFRPIVRLVVEYKYDEVDSILLRSPIGAICDSRFREYVGKKLLKLAIRFMFGGRSRRLHLKHERL